MNSENSTETSRIHRIIADAVIFAALLSLLCLLPNTNGSERFHMALPLAWIADWVLWRREELGKTWRLLWRWPLLGAFCIWAFVSFFTEQFAGFARWPELPWDMLFGASLLVIGVLLHTTIRFVAVKLISIPPIARRARLANMFELVLFIVFFLPYLYVAISVHRIKVWDTTNPKLKYGYNYEAVTFPSAVDNLPLRGWFIPAEHSSATIVICHGINSNMSDFLVAAPFLHDAGYNVFLFDFRGHGDSPGHTTSFGYYEARDVRGAVNYLRGRTDCRRIGALAYSMGGSALLQAIGGTPEIRGAVIDSTFSDMNDLMASHLAFLPSPVRYLALNSIAAASRLEIGITPADIAPVRDAANVSPRPLLIIQGLMDGLVPASEARALYAAARPPRELWLVPLAGHDKAGFVAKDEYHRRVLGLFQKCLH